MNEEAQKIKEISPFCICIVVNFRADFKLSSRKHTHTKERTSLYFEQEFPQVKEIESEFSNSNSIIYCIMYIIQIDSCNSKKRSFLNDEILNYKKSVFST